MNSKCPGQDTRYWTYEDVDETKCPHCGQEMEFFKTDIRLRCRNCGNKVVNEKFDLGCAEWCSFAEYCLGDVVKGYKPESVKKKLKDRASQLLDEQDMEDINKKLDQSKKVAEQEQRDVLEVIAYTVFELIGEKHGWEKVEEIVEQMVANREIKPEIAAKFETLKGASK